VEKYNSGLNMSVLGLGIIVVLTAIACVSLLAFRKTRAAGLGLLGFLGVIIVLGFGLYFSAMDVTRPMIKYGDVVSLEQAAPYQEGGSYVPHKYNVYETPATYFKIGIVAIIILIILAVSGGLLFFLLSKPKTRPWGIGLLVVGPILFLLIIVGLVSSARYQAEVAYGNLDSHPVLRFPQTKPVAINPRQAIETQREFESVFSQQMQSKSGFPLNGRMVRNILLPLPAVLPEAPSVELMQKKIAALEKTIDDMSRVLVNLMTERAKDNIAAKSESLTAKSTTSDTVAAIAAEPGKSLQVQPASSGGSPAKTMSVEKAAEQTAPAETEKTATASSVRRPDWVGKPPRRVGDSYQMSVCTDPYTTRMECDAKVPEVLQGAVDQFVEAYLGRPATGWVRLPPEKLKQLVVDEWEESLQLSMGPMTRVHLLLNFDKKAKNLIDEALNYGQFTERAAVVGTGLIGVWMLLAVIWGYLKLDLASKGAYRNRLRAAAGFAILTTVAMVWLVLGFFA
jgi:hypothetical protein